MSSSLNARLFAARALRAVQDQEDDARELRAADPADALGLPSQRAAQVRPAALRTPA